jgi:hypothetical protein
METAKFIFTAIGTFIGVSSLSLTLLNSWMKKKQEEINAERKMHQEAREILGSAAAFTAME